MKIRDSVHLANEDYATFDFHIHSKYSYDSLLQPRKIIRIAIKRGLSGVAITDHNTIKGGLETLKAAKELKSDLQVIVGNEVRTEFGDLIGLFLAEEIKSRQFDEVLDEIKMQNGFVVLPHPYKKRGDKSIISTNILRKVDAIEGLNARIHPSLNKLAQETAHKYDIPMVGGSDAHLSLEVGRARVIFPRCNDICSSEVLRRALSNNKHILKGKESPHYVHYISVGIEMLKKIWK